MKHNAVPADIRQTLDLLSEGVFFMDPDGRLTGVNRAFTDILGYADGDIRGMTFTDLAATVARIDEHIRENLVALNLQLYYFRRAEKESLPMKMIGKSGATVTVRLRSVIFTNGSGAGIIRREEEPQADSASGQKHGEAERAWEVEENYRNILRSSGDAIIIADFNGWIVTVNEAMLRMLGYAAADELVGRYLVEFVPIVEGSFPCTTGEEITITRRMQKQHIEYSNILFEKGIYTFESYMVKKDSVLVPVETTMTVLQDRQGAYRGAMAICRDITERKLAEKKLKKAHAELEEKVRERTASLEDANTALQVLLQKRKEDRKAVEDKVLFNVRELVAPYLDKLRHSSMSPRQKSCVDIIQSNLDDIIAPFLTGLPEKQLTFTPVEIKVANLIKQGKSTKEISDMLNIGLKTVGFHRDNIRKKAGLKKSKINLRTWLLSIQ